ncbi:MAG TPA: response regulator [Puia sp.]|jgi:DNA-binding NtrC family response regulator|nr:response regulator [Puia sp.]
MVTSPPLKIFLVDDELYCLNLYAQYLNNLGYTRIQYFDKSIECLDQLRLRPDIIFLDYYIDNRNGIDILMKIKRFDPKIPVVFISGQEDIDIAVKALKYGALDYLTKENLDEARIKACVDKVLKIRGMLLKNSKRKKIKKILSGVSPLSAIFYLQKLLSKV